jgi:hypothetical protein
MLEQLANCTTIEEAVMLLLSFDNALSYNKEALLEKYVTEEEAIAIALFLCGTSGCELVHAFIDGHRLQEFLANVAYNAVESVPYILRAIQLRRQKVAEQHRRMFVCLQNASPKKVWVEVEEMQTRYLNFNDNSMSLWLDRACYREKAKLVTKCVNNLSEKDKEEAWAIVKYNTAFPEEVKQYLGL